MNGESAAPPGAKIRERLGGVWAESLAQVFESMAGERPVINWRSEEPPAGGGGAGDEMLWWEQPFPLGAGASTWVGAPQATWEYAGALTLKAAGLETVDAQEARNTWIEMLGQSFAAVAREAGSMLGREIALQPGAERPPGPEATDRNGLSLEFSGETPVSLWFVLGAPLVDALWARDENPPAEPEAAPEEPPEPARPEGVPRTLELLLGIELPVSISFGRKRLPLREVLKLTTGSIVELDRDVDEPVEILVNQCLIARGEVVVVEGNYGVRILEIASRQDRLRSLP